MEQKLPHASTVKTLVLLTLILELHNFIIFRSQMMKLSRVVLIQIISGILSDDMIYDVRQFIENGTYCNPFRIEMRLSSTGRFLLNET